MDVCGEVADCGGDAWVKLDRGKGLANINSRRCKDRKDGRRQLEMG